MKIITSTKFIYKEKWITDELQGRIQTDEIEKISLEIKYTNNDEDIKYNRTYKSVIDLFVFDPNDYDFIAYELDQLSDKINTALRGIKIPDSLIIFKQQKSLRLSSKIGKAIRSVLISNENVLCDYKYYYANRYNRKYKSMETFDLEDWIEFIKRKLEDPYVLGKEISDMLEQY